MAVHDWVEGGKWKIEQLSVQIVKFKVKQLKVVVCQLGLSLL